MFEPYLELLLELFLLFLVFNQVIGFIDFDNVSLKEIKSEYVKDLKTGHCILGYG
jgi:hypothetical protein